MLDGLALLPEDKVQEGMEYIKEDIPAGMEPLVEYFDSVYVTGTFRRIHAPELPADGPPAPLRLRHIPPRFPIPVWNVHQATIEGRARTNNICEGWNNSFGKLIGHCHPTFWTAVDGLRKDLAVVVTQLMQHSRGQLPKKRERRATKEMQKRLQTLCGEFARDERTLEQFLGAIGHCIRLDH